MADSDERATDAYRALRIEDFPKALQPREMLKKAGARQVGEDVLLAVILRVGVAGANVVETARRLLVAFGTLDRLAKATSGEIVAKRIPGIGETKALQVVAALELGRRCSYLELMNGKKEGEAFVRTSEDVYDLLLPELYGCSQERFFVVLLGPRNKVMGKPVEIAKGQRDEVALQANLVFEMPLKEGARAVVVAHNHPSGDPHPSEEDVKMTRKLVEAGRLMNVPLLDHLIVGVSSENRPGFFSLAASGLVKF